MNLVTVSTGQSLVDIALQELGSTAALIDLANANGLSITDPLRPGQLLQVPDSLLSSPTVAAYYAGRQQRVNVPDLVHAGAAPVLPPIATPSRDFLAADTLRKDVY